MQLGFFRAAGGRMWAVSQTGVALCWAVHVAASNAYQYILWRGCETGILRQFVGEPNRAASALKACRLPAYGVHDGAKMLVCSEELAEMFGVTSPAEIVGREVFSFVAPEERDRAIASIAAGATESYLSVGVRPDGATFPIRIESRPVRSKECGEGRLVLVRDLSPIALVVDDEPPVARMTAMLTRYAGYQPVTCTSPRQALAGYQSGDVSVIVTDVLMPELDGVAMAKGIREIDPLVPVVFVSGYTNIAVPRDDQTVFVRKPFGMEDLRAALAGLPERARANLE